MAMRLDFNGVTGAYAHVARTQIQGPLIEGIIRIFPARADRENMQAKLAEYLFTYPVDKPPTDELAYIYIRAHNEPEFKTAVAT